MVLVKDLGAPWPQITHGENILHHAHHSNGNLARLSCYVPSYVHLPSHPSKLSHLILAFLTEKSPSVRVGNKPLSLQ